MTDILIFIEDNPWVGQVFWTLMGLLITAIFIRVINRIMYKQIEDTNTYYMARKRVYYLVSIIYVVYTLAIWMDAAVDFSTYVGLLSAGMAIALKDTVSNIAAWLFIIIKRPFKVGDRIAISTHQGDVIDVRMFQFSLMEINTKDNGDQSTGRIIDVPNHFIFIHPVINYVKGFEFIWNEIKIEITFESDWEKAKAAFEKIVNKHTLHLSDTANEKIKEAARKYMIFYNKLTPIVYTEVRASGVELTLRYLCNPRQRRATVNDIWEDVLRVVNADEAIDLAYPTRRVVN